jgi:excisionase family DNA binding protein
VLSQAIYCGTVAPFRPILGLGRSYWRTGSANFPALSPLRVRAMPEADECLTVADVAAMLKLNQQTIRNRIDAGKLPNVRVGRA